MHYIICCNGCCHRKVKVMEVMGVMEVKKVEIMEVMEIMEIMEMTTPQTVHGGVSVDLKAVVKAGSFHVNDDSVAVLKSCFNEESG